jgi:CelD/BcsL family acetyltransferase involved in cellulose biosynthesis
MIFQPQGRCPRWLADPPARPPPFWHNDLSEPLPPRRALRCSTILNETLTLFSLRFAVSFLDARLPPASALARSLPPGGDGEKSSAERARRPFASVEVLTDIEAARPVWAEIGAHAVASPYQSYEFSMHWSRTIGASSKVSPWIVVARDRAGTVSALLPLGRFRRGLIHRAAFVGGRLANFQMGLFRVGVDWTDADVAELLRAAALAGPRVDVFMLANQPFAWAGSPNPMVGLGAWPSPSCAYSSALPASFSFWRDAHYSKPTQKKLRKKAQRLGAIGPLTHSRAYGADEVGAVVEALLAQKRARLRVLGLPNEFDGETTIALLTRLSGDEAPVLELHALRAGERIVATFAGLSNGVRLSGLFLSHDMDPVVAVASPGELLIMEVVRDAIARGVVTFDLGVGEARYKNQCCETTEALFDSALGITMAGRIAAAAFLAGRRIKARVKRSPSLLRLAIRARRLASRPIPR